MGPRPVWTGAENLAPTKIRFLDRPARSQSLYRLRYSAHMVRVSRNNITFFKNTDALSHLPLILITDFTSPTGLYDKDSDQQTQQE